MPVYRLDERHLFPSPAEAEPDGLLAVGGDLDPRRVLLAYTQGIFPWPHDDLPLMWFSPDPRLVFPPGAPSVSRSLRARLRRGDLEVTFDRAFDEVVEACATAPRPGQDGTWITGGMSRAYGDLHRAGIAHSVEVWREGALVGGLYGLSLGAAFFGESMFSAVTDASKVALVRLCEQAWGWGFRFVDGQVSSPHLTRMGGVEWTRDHYLRELRAALAVPTRQGPWELEGVAAPQATPRPRSSRAAVRGASPPREASV